MSIYPVSIKDWYINGKEESFGGEWEMLQNILPSLRCEECDGLIEAEKGLVMHSITFGGPSEAWCSIECLEGDKEDDENDREEWEDDHYLNRMDEIRGDYRREE